MKVAECLYRHASGTYYGLVKRGGKQIRRSLKTSDRQLATRRLSEFRSKVSRLTETGQGGKIRFDELARRWFDSVKMTLKPNTARGHGIIIRNLSGRFGDMPVRSITVRDCEDWATQRGSAVAASTYNSERGILTAILALARRDGLLLDNPAEHVPRRKMEKPALEIPTRAQFVQLVSAMRALDVRAFPGADLIELLGYSGMRLSEGTSLMWGDIDWHSERFVVTGGEQGTKNGEARSVPLFPALRALLQKLRGDCQPVSGDLERTQSEPHLRLAAGVRDDVRRRGWAECRRHGRQSTGDSVPDSLHDGRGRSRCARWEPCSMCEGRPPRSKCW